MGGRIHSVAESVEEPCKPHAPGARMLHPPRRSKEARCPILLLRACVLRQKP
jgi:hypothetical protein